MSRGLVVVILLSALVVVPAWSKDTSGKFGVTLSGGYYSPDLGELNGTGFYGGSFTYHFLPWLYGEINALVFNRKISELTLIDDRVMKHYIVWAGQEGRLPNEYSTTRHSYESVKARIVPVDFNVGFSFLNEKKINPYVTLGATYFAARIDHLPKASDSAWGLNGGGGIELFLAELKERLDISLIMDCRYRWGKVDFGLGFMSMTEESRYVGSPDVKEKWDIYKTVELEDLPNRLKVGGLSASAGIRIYF